MQNALQEARTMWKIKLSHGLNQHYRMIVYVRHHMILDPRNQRLLVGYSPQKSAIFRGRIISNIRTIVRKVISTYMRVYRV